eukprot:7832231-Karenia_brevis.AAC.1
MAVMCDKNHPHKPWGLVADSKGFATAAERQYPSLFCSRMARLIKDQLDPFKSDPKIQAMRQPRRHTEVLIADWKSSDTL